MNVKMTDVQSFLENKDLFLKYYERITSEDIFKIHFETRKISLKISEYLTRIKGDREGGEEAKTYFSQKKLGTLYLLRTLTEMWLEDTLSEEEKEERKNYTGLDSFECVERYLDKSHERINRAEWDELSWEFAEQETKGYSKSLEQIALDLGHNESYFRYHEIDSGLFYYKKLISNIEEYLGAVDIDINKLVNLNYEMKNQGYHI